MKINLKNKYILILLCITLLIPVFCSIQNAVANQHIVGNNIKFTYPDGSWFYNPGLYSTISCIDDVWYFDGAAYSGPVNIGTEAASAIVSVFTNVYIAIGLIGIGFIILSCFLIIQATKGESEENNKSMLTGVVILIISVVFIVVAFAIIIGFENAISNAYINYP